MPSVFFDYYYENRSPSTAAGAVLETLCSSMRYPMPTIAIPVSSVTRCEMGLNLVPSSNTPRAGKTRLYLLLILLLISLIRTFVMGHFERDHVAMNSSKTLCISDGFQ